MSDLPFALPGRFWRGNLHTHSNRSDGALSPAETAQIYRDAGYDFIALTDHFRPEYGYPITDTRDLRSVGFTTLIGAELHAPRTEAGQEWHIVAVGLPLDFPPPSDAETGPELARRARATGAFIGMAHPSASLLTAADAESLDAAHSVEVYNALADRENRGDSWHLTDVLLNRGHRLTAYAADDAHLQPQDPPPCQAWVHVRAESLDPDALLTALIAGHFYSSTGPELYDVQIDGDDDHRPLLTRHQGPADRRSPRRRGPPRHRPHRMHLPPRPLRQHPLPHHHRRRQRRPRLDQPHPPGRRDRAVG